MDTQKPNGTQLAKKADLGAANREKLSSKDRGQQLARRRKVRIQDFLAEILESSNTLRACMGPLMCDLLSTCYDLKVTMDQQGASTSSAVDRWKRRMPVFETYLKVVRQVDRLAQLDCRINELRLGRREGESAQSKETAERTSENPAA